MQMGTNLPKVGGYNRAVVMDAIQLHDGISRVEIAQRTGLTPQTVSGIVRKLLLEGLIREDGSAQSTGGKPRTILRINPTAGYAVGIQFDPAEISFVVADMAGKPVIARRRPAPVGSESADVISEMAATIRQLLRETRIPRRKVLGVGVGCPGPIDQEKGIVLSPPQLSHWEGVPLKQLLEESIRLPVTVDNDATAAAIGERWAGAGRGVANFAYLYLGTGIGGGLFLGNQVYRGSTSNAAELGHITIAPDGPDCYCGNRGCLEVLCSPVAISRAAQEALKDGVASSLAEVSTVDYEAVVAADLAGDRLAGEILGTVAGHLATAMVNTANILDIQLIVLGGYATRGVGPRYRAAIAEALRTRPIARRVRDIDVRLSQIAEDAGAIGAASMVFHAEFSPNLDHLWGASTARMP